MWHGKFWKWQETWFQVLGAKNLVPISWYHAYVTKNVVPASWYQDSASKCGTKLLVPSSWYQDPGILNSVPRPRLGTRILSQESRYWDFDSKFVVLKSWYRHLSTEFSVTKIWHDMTRMTQYDTKLVCVAWTAMACKVKARGHPGLAIGVLEVSLFGLWAWFRWNYGTWDHVFGFDSFVPINSSTWYCELITFCGVFTETLPICWVLNQSLYFTCAVLELGSAQTIASDKQLCLCEAE